MIVRRSPQYSGIQQSKILCGAARRERPGIADDHQPEKQPTPQSVVGSLHGADSRRLEEGEAHVIDCALPSALAVADYLHIEARRELLGRSIVAARDLGPGHDETPVVFASTRESQLTGSCNPPPIVTLRLYYDAAHGDDYGERPQRQCRSESSAVGGVPQYIPGAGSRGSWFGHRIEHLETSHHMGFGSIVGVRSHQT